jgi:hypothetical protein
MPAELFYMDTEIWVKTPYDADFVESIKAEIPKEYRRWDSEEKVWAVSYLYEDDLIRLCKIYYDGVVQYGRQTYATVPQSPQAYATLHLLPSAPREVVMAAYRALSKLYHPDVSQKPDATEKMKEINIAFDRIMSKN